MIRYYVVLLLLAVSCTTTYRPDKVYKLTILHTNDHHGRFWSNRDGEWGLAARTTLINDIRNEVKKSGGEFLLLDAGDVNTGVPQSDMLKAEPDFKGMARIGYDAMAVGNHEFDNDLETIKKQEGWAGFPFLSANIYKDGQRIFKPYLTKKLDGLTVNILGLTTKDAPVKSKMGTQLGLDVRDPIAEAAAIVPKLKKKGQVLIALTHMGHYPNESHGSDAPGDVTLARQVSGIDVIIGGHTQLPLFKPDLQNGAYIVQAHEWGKYVGRIDLEIQNGKVTLKHYELIPINHKDKKEKIVENAEMLAFLKPFKDKGDKTLLVEVGETIEKLEGDRAVVRVKETNLGNLITTSFRTKFKADIGLANSGGIRDSIAPGKINYEQILTVMPFGNDIVTVQLSGKELKPYLAKVLGDLTPGTGSFPQTSGLAATLNAKTKTFQKLLVNGKPVSDTATYTIALPAFVAKGGDNWPDLSKAGIKTWGFMDADVLREYLSNRGAVGTGEFGPFGQVRVIR